MKPGQQQGEDQSVLVIGAGIFGVTASIELRRRGYAVTLLDAGAVPHPLAASTDISKVCRMEYGKDEAYMALMEHAREGWLEWDARWVASGQLPLYEEDGVVMVCRRPMAPGGYEHESFELLKQRGHTPQRLDQRELERRFPAWSSGAYVDGFFHPHGGYAHSGRVVEALLSEARALGVQIEENRAVQRLLEDGNGLIDARGDELRADAVVVAAGSWTYKLVPELAPCMRATGHAVFHLRPADEALFEAQRFPVFTADIARTGFYGFPLHPRERIVKIALHDLGAAIDPDAPRAIDASHEARLRAFLPETFPALVDAPVTYTRLCLYSDTQDEDFWIAAHPERPHLIVAAGGSGHAFKFAPLLGELIADAVEGKSNDGSEKFRWRSDVRLAVGREAARCHAGEANGSE